MQFIFAQTIEILDELGEKGSETMDIRNKDEVVSRLKVAVASKQFGLEDILSSLIADVSIFASRFHVPFIFLLSRDNIIGDAIIGQACIQVCPKNPANFNVDNVRVAKLVSDGLHNCSIVREMVLKNDVIGSIKKVEKAKVTPY